MSDRFLRHQILFFSRYEGRCLSGRLGGRLSRCLSRCMGGSRRECLRWGCSVGRHRCVCGDWRDRRCQGDIGRQGNRRRSGGGRRDCRGEYYRPGLIDPQNQPAQAITRKSRQYHQDQNVPNPLFFAQVFQDTSNPSNHNTRRQAGQGRTDGPAKRRDPGGSGWFLNNKKYPGRIDLQLSAPTQRTINRFNFKPGFSQKKLQVGYRVAALAMGLLDAFPQLTG
jgi:hypothetical protein